MYAARIFRVLGLIYTVLGGLFLTGALVGGLMFGLPLLFLLVFGGIGALFFVLGLIFLLVQRRKARLRQWLLENGTPTEAEVLRVEQNFAIQYNGLSPYRVICRYTADGVDYICHSEELRYPPEGLGATVTVYCDPLRRKRYFVELPPAFERPTVIL